MTEIILARHGETEWNIGEIFRGRIDIGLNKTGIKQAELLGEYLSNFKIEAVQSSPLKRAFRTAEIIANHHQLEVTTNPSLIDLDFGEWQGLSHQGVKDKYKDLYAQWTSSPDAVQMPKGESLNDVTKRATAVVNDVITRYNGTVVLMSHRVVNKVLICALLGLDNSHFWNIRQDTCGLTTFTYEKKRFILKNHNDTSFLKPDQKARLADF